MLRKSVVERMAQSALTIFSCRLRRNWFPVLVLVLALAAWATGHNEILACAAMAAVMPGKQPAPLAPFRYNTRARFRPVNKSRAFENDAQLEDVVLLNVGLAARLWIHLHGTMAVNAAGAFKDRGPWNILKRIMLESNDGGVVNVDLTGFGSFLIGATSLTPGFAPNGGAVTPHPDIYAAGIANVQDNAWSLWFPVPINMSQEENRSGGLIALQSREIQITLKVTTEDVANVVTNVDADPGFTGNLDFYIESYAVPPQGVALPEFDIIHTFETTKAFTETGYIDYDVPKLGALLQLIHVLTIDGARSDEMERWELTFNDNDTPRKVDRAWLRLLQRIRTGTELPVGCYSIDFCAGSQSLFNDDLPDVLDTRQIALMQSRIYVSDTAVLGANNNSITTIRRVLAAARVAQ